MSAADIDDNEHHDKGKMLLDRGRELYELKRYIEARAAYESAIQFDSSSEGVYRDQGRTLFNKAKELFELRRYDEAYTAFQDATK